MKRLVVLTACLAALGPAQAQDARDLPANIRIIAEYIEAPHTLVTQVMAGEHADSGPKLHARMRELVKENKARILETSFVTARSGYRARAESVMEHIYPTEYQPPGRPGTFIGSGPSRSDDAADEAKPPRDHRWPTAFETRNVGVTLDIEPVLQTNRNLVDLRFTQEMTRLLRYEMWSEYRDQWGDAPIRFPIYEALESESIVTLLDGKFGFVGLLTPSKKSGSPDTSRKILLFVRADIIPIGP